MAVHRCHGRVYSGSHVVRLLPLEANHRRKQQWQPAVVIKTASTKQRTMESVRSAFHAQLATVMDSLLAAAVCEIAKIFESSLCEQQAELAQKTEELSILRCKLEKVERRQKAKGGGSEEGEMSSGDREGSLRQQTLTGSGITAVFDSSWFMNNSIWSSSGHRHHIYTCSSRYQLHWTCCVHHYVALLPTELVPEMVTNYSSLAQDWIWEKMSLLILTQ